MNLCKIELESRLGFFVSMYIFFQCVCMCKEFKLRFYLILEYRPSLLDLSDEYQLVQPTAKTRKITSFKDGNPYS